MTSAIRLVIQFLLADLLAHVLYSYYFHPLARYPGPFLAHFTNIWKFASFLRGQHHLTEEKLHQRYGPIVRVAPNWLSFSQLPAFEAIYGFHKAIEKDDFYTFGEGRRRRPQRDVSVFAAQSNLVHRQKRRRMLGPALTRAQIRRYEPVIARHVAVLVGRLEEEVVARLEQEREREQEQVGLLGELTVTVNVAPLVHRFTLDVMLDILFGPAVGPHPYTDNDVAGNLGASIRYVSKMVWSYSLWPLFGWLMNTRLAVACLRRPRYNAEGAMVGLNGLLHRGAAAILMGPEVFAGEGDSQPGIVKSWLLGGLGSSANGVADHHHHHHHHHHQKMTPAEAVSEAFNLVFAGPGSMAAALTAILYQLGLPEGHIWQEKLRAGVEGEALEGSTSTDASSLPLSSSSLELQAVIKETLRFRAPFPTAFPRVIRSGAEMAIPGLSHPLPAGTTVSASTYVLGRSREIWGDDADRWVPQRWLGSGSSDDDEESRRQLDRRFVAFSRGPRGCSGRDLASLILAKAVRAIVHRWRFSAAAAELRGSSFLEMQYDQCLLRFARRSSSD